jgi:hypothetical protein
MWGVRGSGIGNTIIFRDDGGYATRLEGGELLCAPTALQTLPKSSYITVRGYLLKKLAVRKAFGISGAMIIYENTQH